MNWLYQYFGNQMKPIGVKGQKDSGKSKVAEYLQTNYACEEEYFSRALKEIIVIMTGWSYAYVNGETEEYKIARETVIHPDFGLTCRQMLQQIGTNLFRNQFDKDVWVKIMKRRIEESPERSVVFSDLRFPNECQMVQDLGGVVIRLRREMPDAPQDTHESETVFETEGEIIVDNNGTLEELYRKIDTIIKNNI